MPSRTPNSFSDCSTLRLAVTSSISTDSVISRQSSPGSRPESLRDVMTSLVRSAALICRAERLTATLLGAVHGGVGVAQERVGGGVGRLAGAGDAQTGGDGDVATLDAEVGAESGDEALGDGERLPVAVEVVAEDDELVAAEAGHAV